MKLLFFSKFYVNSKLSIIYKLSVYSKIIRYFKLSIFSPPNLSAILKLLKHFPQIFFYCPLIQNTFFLKCPQFQNCPFFNYEFSILYYFSGILGSRITANVETTWKLRIRIFLSRRLAIHATLNNVHSIHRQFATHGVGFRRRFTSRFSIFVIH